MCNNSYQQAYEQACKDVGKRQVDNYIRYAQKHGLRIDADKLKRFVEMTLKRKEIRKETR